MIEAKNKQGRCILVCAGQFTPIEIPVDEQDYVIAVDGGFSYCQMLGILPNLIVGDFDSVSDKDLEQIEQIECCAPERVRRFVPEKDDTDTIAAVKIGLEKGYRKFFLYGALGGRLDHTIANIQTLLYIKNREATGYIMSHDSLLTVIRDEEIHFHRGMEGRMSLFCLGEHASGVSISGMKYPLQNATLTNDFPIGISNEFLAQEEGYIGVENGALFVMVEWVNDLPC